MFLETRRFSSPSGALLAYHHQPAGGEKALAILLVNHGMIEHSLRYADFAAAMARHGYHVYAHDHRGHGETVASEAPLGRFAHTNGIDRVIEDVKAMRDLAALEHPGLPVILFGHSMGGLIALNAAAVHPRSFTAVAIWNSNFNTGLSGRVASIVLALERMLKGSDVPSAILPRSTFDAWGKSIPGARTPYDWLSRDATVVDRYAADPLCRFDASVSMWLDVVEMANRGAQARNLSRLPPSLPFHLVGGGQDPATRAGKDVAWLAARLKARGLKVTHRHYTDLRHETLNEIGREVAIEDFLRWCNSVISTPQDRFPEPRVGALSEME